MNLRTQLSLLTIAVIACGVCGCGLKGPLELPERPTNIVIRPAPGAAGTATGQGATAPTAPAATPPSTTAPATAPPSTTPPTTAPGETAPAGETPATPAPAEEEPERLPPPELPRGQRGGVAS